MGASERAARGPLEDHVSGTLHSRARGDVQLRRPYLCGQTRRMTKANVGRGSAARWQRLPGQRPRLGEASDDKHIIASADSCPRPVAHRRAPSRIFGCRPGPASTLSNAHSKLASTAAKASAYLLICRRGYAYSCAPTLRVTNITSTNEDDNADGLDSRHQRYETRR